MVGEILEKTSVEGNIMSWRKKVCDSVFYFLSIFGFLAYIPSVIISIEEGMWQILIVNTFIYAVCVYLTLNKSISYIVKSSIGSFLIYLLGVYLIIEVGIYGAGEIWLFASTIITTLLLGNRGAMISFITTSITMIAIYFVIISGGTKWQTTFTGPEVYWTIKTTSFIVLNFIVVIVNKIYTSGFRKTLVELIKTRNATIIGLAKLAEHRDNETGDHLKRLQDLTLMLGHQLQELPQFRDYITNEYLEDLYLSSLLHDIGKVGIGDAILLKPGSLTKDEFELVKEHTLIGYNVVKEIEENISSESIYSMGKEIALNHHEKWDGSGYPLGKKGKEIPLSARIVALVDVYDALRSKRPYKESFTHEEAVNIIINDRGKHFDPDLVDAFIDIEQEFNNKQFPDS